jgi:hypothetical protein
MMSLWFEYENDSIGIRTSPDVSSAFALTLILTLQVTKSVTNALKVKELITNVVKQFLSERNLVLNQLYLYYICYGKKNFTFLKITRFHRGENFTLAFKQFLSKLFQLFQSFIFNEKHCKLQSARIIERNVEKTMRKRWENVEKVESLVRIKVKIVLSDRPVGRLKKDK